MLEALAQLGRRVGWLALPALACMLAACAQPGAGPAALPEAKVQRLGDLFVQAVPVGEIARVVAERNPLWPVQNLSPGKVTPAQTACLRAELSPAKVSSFQRQDARTFAQRHPEQLDDAIRVLDGGGASLMGRMVMAGGDEAISGKRVDPAAVMRDATPGQINQFMNLLQHNDYAELRQALQFDGLKGDRALDRERGRQIGRALLMRPLLAAMETCKVPASTLF